MQDVRTWTQHLVAYGLTGQWFSGSVRAGRELDGYADEVLSWSGNMSGWSSSVARGPHKPKVVGSNPTPATRP